MQRIAHPVNGQNAYSFMVMWVTAHTCVWFVVGLQGQYAPPLGPPTPLPARGDTVGFISSVPVRRAKKMVEMRGVGAEVSMGQYASFTHASAPATASPYMQLNRLRPASLPHCTRPTTTAQNGCPA